MKKTLIKNAKIYDGNKDISAVRLNMRIRAGAFHQVRYEYPHQIECQYGRSIFLFTYTFKGKCKNK